MKRKWLINTCRPLPFVSPANDKREELVSYYGKFVSNESIEPGKEREEVRLRFWATSRNGVARMLSALSMGPLSSHELINEMEKVQP